jgi:hypothetical protein
MYKAAVRHKKEGSFKPVHNTLKVSPQIEVFISYGY